MVLRLENVHKSYATGFWMRRRAVLRGVDLQVDAGEAYGLLGDNGAGKSTTLRVLLGLVRPERGTGTLLGAPLGDRAARARLGYLPESPSFHESLTAIEMLLLCGQLLGLRGAALRGRALRLLDRLELGAARDLRLRKLSKGMLQRLGLAQALLGEPELLVLDEPMSGLDPQGRKLVRDIILAERHAGRTVLFSTHILSDVEMVCTRAGILRGGVVARELRLEDLADATTAVEVQAAGIGAADLGRDAREVVQVAARVTCTVAPGAPLHRLLQRILAAGGSIDAVTPRRTSLEAIFLQAAGTAPVEATSRDCIHTVDEAPAAPHESVHA